MKTFPAFAITFLALISAPAIMRADYRNIEFPTSEYDALGFRVASIPEPSPLLLAALAVAGLASRRRTSRHDDELAKVAKLAAPQGIALRCFHQNFL